VISLPKKGGHTLKIIIGAIGIGKKYNGYEKYNMYVHDILPVLSCVREIASGLALYNDISVMYKRLLLA